MIRRKPFISLFPPYSNLPDFPKTRSGVDGGVNWWGCSTEVWVLIVPYSWVSITAPCFKEKPFWPRLKAVFIYGYKNKYLEGNLTPWPLSKITITVSVLGPMTFPFSQVLLARIAEQAMKTLCCGAGLSSNHRALVTPWQLCHCCSRGHILPEVALKQEGSELWCLPALWKLGDRENASRSLWDWFLCVLQLEFVVSSNGVLPRCWAMAMACVVCGDSWGFPDPPELYCNFDLIAHVFWE